MNIRIAERAKYRTQQNLIRRIIQITKIGTFVEQDEHNRNRTIPIPTQTKSWKIGKATKE